MGRRRLGALCVASGFDHHHRLGTGRGAGCRHELAGVPYRFDIEQDRARRAVQSEKIQEIAEIDVELIADRHHRREADGALCRPFGHSGDDGTGLGDEREIASARHPGREACIEIRGGRHDPEAVRTDDAQTLFAGGAFGSLRERPSAVPEPGREDDRGGDAGPGRPRDDLRHRIRRRGNDRDIGRRIDGIDAGGRRDPLDLAVVRIDQSEGTGKARGAQIAQHRAADRALTRARAHQGDRARTEQLFEPIGRHGSPRTRAANKGPGGA